MMAVWVGMVQNVLSKATKYALFDPTKEMAYIPLDKESKVRYSTGSTNNYVFDKYLHKNFYISPRSLRDPPVDLLVCLLSLGKTIYVHVHVGVFYFVSRVNHKKIGPISCW